MSIDIGRKWTIYSVQQHTYFKNEASPPSIPINSPDFFKNLVLAGKLSDRTSKQEMRDGEISTPLSIIRLIEEASVPGEGNDCLIAAH